MDKQPIASPGDRGDEQRTKAIGRIRHFLDGASLEATRPSASDIDELKARLRPGSNVYLSAVPRRPFREQIEAARLLRRAGLAPVPHLGVRNFESLAQLREHLTALTGEAAVDDVLIIGGDIPTPKGTLSDALSVIESGVIEASGIKRVGFAGYPEGHPSISGEALESALVTKVASAQGRDLDVRIVTQFCFDPTVVIAWITWLRTRGIHLPVSVGMAGPTSLITWLNYARRCGVRASAQALARRSGLARQAFHSVAPDAIVRALADWIHEGTTVAAASTNIAAGGAVAADVSAHFFSFGGLLPTARWLEGAAKGNLALDGEGGFEVLKSGH